METLAEQKRLRIEQMRARGIGKYATPGGGDASAPDASSGGSQHPRAPVAVDTAALIPGHDPWAPPHGWIGAPPCGTLTCDVFVPSKTPLSRRWHDGGRVPPDRRYLPSDALAAASAAASGRPVKLVVDLTNSSRYYDPVDFEIHGAAHVKVPCVGKDEPPDPVAVSHFVHLVQKFIANQAAAAAAKDAKDANPNAAAAPKPNAAGVILVHCTHGFNRTGAMLVHYMQRARKWPKLNEHVAEFARHRPPGIYKPEYLKLLFAEYLERRFSTTKDPPLPEWKRRGWLAAAGGGGEDGTSIDAPPLEDADVPPGDLFGDDNDEYVRTRAESIIDRPGTRGGGNGGGEGAAGGWSENMLRTTADGNLDGTPMHHDDVLGTPVHEDQADEIKRVVAYLCGANPNATVFPGSQPVSLARDNMQIIKRREYHVTWKADGTRYMLLLMKDGTYLIDRKFDVRRVSMRFPAPLRRFGVATHHATLLDGEMVIDDVNANSHANANGHANGHDADANANATPRKQRRRFLAYDMMALMGERLVDRPFAERLGFIGEYVVKPRNVFLLEAGKSGAYDFSKEPFSTRAKDFSPLAGTEKFVRDFIPKLCHECDGLIFQPSREKYVVGTLDGLLKWKFTHLNSVDFRLRVNVHGGPELFVGGDRGIEVGPIAEPSAAFELGLDDDGRAADGTRPELRDLDGKIVECTWDKTGNKNQGAWKYLRIRSDKDTPNFQTVYKHTLRSILDDITDEEIISFVDGVVSSGGGDGGGGGAKAAPEPRKERQQVAIDDI